MKKPFKVFLFIFVVIFFFTSCSTLGSVDTKGIKIDGKQFLGKGKYLGKYWPTDNWRSCQPEEVGINSDNLAKAIEYASNPEFKTEGIVIVKNGYIVGEAYLNYFEQDDDHTSYSMAKSFTSALIGIAIDKGLIAGVDEKICQYDDYWDCNDKEDLRSKITIRHAMTLTSGLEWHEDWSKWDPATNDALKMGAGGYFAKYMSDRKGLHEPGQQFYYSTGDPMLLSRVIQKATGKTAFEFAKQTLFKPLNITSVDWVNDVDGYTSTAWGLEMTARDYAKFGYLYLNKGRWENKQIVSKQWVEKSTQTDPSVKMWPAYGYLWHVNLPLRLRGQSSEPTDAIPSDGYMAEGILGQNIFIIPSKDLVIVKVANQQQAQLGLVKFLNLILKSIDK